MNTENEMLNKENGSQGIDINFKRLIDDLGWVKIGSAVNLDYGHVSGFSDEDSRIAFDLDYLNGRGFLITNANPASGAHAVGSANTLKNQEAWSVAVGASFSADTVISKGGVSAHYEMAKNQCEAKSVSIIKCFAYQRVAVRMGNYPTSDKGHMSLLECATEGFQDSMRPIVNITNKIQEKKKSFENHVYCNENNIKIENIVGNDKYPRDKAIEKINAFITGIYLDPKNPLNKYWIKCISSQQKDDFQKTVVRPLEDYRYYAYADDGLYNAYRNFYSIWGTGCVSTIVHGSVALVEVSTMQSSAVQIDNYSGGIQAEYSGTVVTAKGSVEATKQLMNSREQKGFSCDFFATPPESASAASIKSIYDNLLSKNLSELTTDKAWTNAFEAAKPVGLTISYDAKQPPKIPNILEAIKSDTAEMCLLDEELKKLARTDGWVQYKKYRTDNKKPLDHEEPRAEDIKEYQDWLKGKLPKKEDRESSSSDTPLIGDIIRTMPIEGDSIEMLTAQSDSGSGNTSDSDDPKPKYAVLGFKYKGWHQLFPFFFPKPVNELLSITQNVGMQATFWLEEEALLIQYLKFCTRFPTYYSIETEIGSVINGMLKALGNAAKGLLAKYGSIPDKNNKNVMTLDDLDKAKELYKKELNEYASYIMTSGIYDFVHEKNNKEFIKSCPLGLIPVLKNEKETAGPYVYFRFRTEPSKGAQYQIAYGWLSKGRAGEAKPPEANILLDHNAIRLYPVVHYKELSKPKFIYISHQALNKGDNIFESRDTCNKLYNLLSTPTEKFITKIHQRSWVFLKWNNPFNIGWYDQESATILHNTNVELEYKSNLRAYQVKINGNNTPFFGYNDKFDYVDDSYEEYKEFHRLGRENPMKYYYVPDPDRHYRKGGWTNNEVQPCELYLIPANFNHAGLVNHSLTGLPMFPESSIAKLYDMSDSLRKSEKAAEKFKQIIGIVDIDNDD